MKEQLFDMKQALKSILGLRNTFGDHIIITDEVLVWEGKKLRFKSKAHIVNQGLIGIINMICAYQAPNPIAMPSYGWLSLTPTYMRVGTGGGVTTGSTTGLTTPNATAPNSQAGATSNPTGGTYRISWLATWNAGTLTAITVSELGLWLDIVATLQAFNWNYASPSGNFFSRLSDADGDFTAFLVNIAVPLTIEWRLTFTFA